MPHNWHQKTQNTQPIKPILLHLPEDMLAELNHISKRLGIARAELIRRCLKRDLSFVKTVELNGLRELQTSISERYRRQMMEAT